MTNTTIIKEMLQNGYNDLAFTQNYIMGYIKNGVVYATFCTASEVDKVTCLDKASGNAGYALRFKPNKAHKDFLMVYGSKTVAIGSKEMMEAEFKSTKYNRGEIFEKMVTEYFGQVWEKDNVPFTEAGDIVIDGIHYQIKFEKATFTNEKTLLNMRKGA